MATQTDLSITELSTSQKQFSLWSQTTSDNAESVKNVFKSFLKKASHHPSSVSRKTTTIFHSCLTGKLVIGWISLLAQQWKRNPFHWKQLSYQESPCSLGYYDYLGLWITGSPSVGQYLNRIKYECTLKPILCRLKTHADKWTCETLLRPTNVGNIELSNCSGFINKLGKVDHYSEMWLTQKL